jgi:hypothetical protein
MGHKSRGRQPQRDVKAAQSVMQRDQANQVFDRLKQDVLAEVGERMALVFRRYHRKHIEPVLARLERIEEHLGLEPMPGPEEPESEEG